MKKLYIKALAALALAMSVTSCGDDFLKTEMSNALDLETALDSPENVGNALNGTYYRLFQYYFAGNYAYIIGDLASDISYWNGDTSHQDAVYRFGYTDTEYSFEYIWEYGYKVVDNSTRVINACDKLLPNASGDDVDYLTLYKAEAYALRAYANTQMALTFCHQPKVNGKDFSDRLGLVISETPIGVNDEVKRATVGETWAFIVSDLKNSLACFDEVGGDRGDMFYWNYAAASGLLARVSLYLEDYAAAKQYAQQAISVSGITTLTYNAADYHALFNGGDSNDESMFALAINASNNWSANSLGTLFSTYGYSPAPKLMAMYGDDDIRLSIMDFASNSTPIKPWYAGGKFSCYATGNPAMATNYIINAPEMFLIMAEADAKTGNASAAAENLLVVAKRNPAIASVADLPSDAAGIMAFIKDERARELFQEGLRFWDLRRWDEKPGLYAVGAPEVAYSFSNVNVGDIVFPIPADEINTHSGVEQNPDWSTSRPQK